MEGEVGPNMTTTTPEMDARRFLDEAAKIMGKHGEAPKLKGKRYELAVQSIARTFETLDSARLRRQEEQQLAVE